MTKQGKKYLSDILRGIELIDQFTVSVNNYNHYLSDYKTQSAVERQPGIIGEAVNKFDKLFQDFPIENARQIVGLKIG